MSPDEIKAIAEEAGVPQSDSQAEFLARASSDEPLHPDLVPWLEETEWGPMLKHPLVYEAWGIRPGLVNDRYEYKKRALAEARAQGRWHTVVFLHERPYRAKALWDLTQDPATAEAMSIVAFAKLLAQVWIDSENIWQNFDVWEELFSGLDDSDLVRRHMMDEEEWAKYQSLPEWITVYRGCIEGLNEDGLSWTLDRKRAGWFARRFAGVGGRDGEPRVLVGTVLKSNALAYFAGRGEEEIVVTHDGEVVIERIEEP